ncbi:MAG: phage holin family protein [Rubrivivax sp.]|nr:phage holin family protein [Rubrivivax sp.]
MAVTGPPATGGLFESLRRLLATTLGIAQVRLELFGTELEAEKLRLFDALWRAALGLLLLGVALVLAVGFVLMLFWEGYRLPALAVTTLFFVAAGAALLVRARALLRAGEGGPFVLSLGELQRDRDGLQPAPAATAEPPANAPGPP